MTWKDYLLWAEPELERRGYKLSQAKRMSEAILELSNLYQTSQRTPWEKVSTQAAYLAYFMPLNFLRAQAVFDIYQKSAPSLFERLQNHPTVLDFGSGSGTSEWLLSSCLQQEFSIDCFEIADQALELHRSFHTFLQRFQKSDLDLNPSSSKTYTLGLFQTSLNEVGSLPPGALQCEQLMLIEPSTHQKARPLMALREPLIQEGYSIWAPCTHSAACPLLAQSKRDWCHDRRTIETPPWMQAFKPYLPIENKDVTFSYLIVARLEAPKLLQNARVIGDPLVEKGKTRQMVCRSEYREFLSWLHRKGDFTTPHRGDLISTLNWPNPPQNEIRI